MVFSSATFLFIFLPPGIILYYTFPGRLKNICLLVLSLFFYAWGEPKGIIWLLTSITANYVIALVIDKLHKNNKNSLSQASMFAAVLFNLGLLFYYKYFNFTIDSINHIFSAGIKEREIALPIGISFFTFKSLAYILDVYKRKYKAEKNILDLGVYIAFFPQLMAGPIARYDDMRPQLKQRSFSTNQFYDGSIRFMTGMSKKVLLSDQLITLVSVIFSNNGYSAPAAWLGAIAYSLQIYFDFSGYSDMAIGLGKMLGFETKENFNLPYIAVSIQDFWRRWHISLSSWFRDYVYIPLGGSRVSRGRTYLNTAIVFFLTGLWHGANWTFIVWGLFYVIFLIAERAGLKEVLNKLPKAIQHLYTAVIVMIGWVIFRSDNVPQALMYIKNMFLVNSRSIVDLISVLDSQLIVCIILGIFFSTGAAVPIKERLSKKLWLYNSCIVFAFLLAVSYMWGAGFTPFLYFRF